MRIVPLINADFFGRYQKCNNTVIDTFTNRDIESTIDAETLLERLNKIGMLNSHIIDSNARLPKAKQAKLFTVVA